MSVKEEVLRQLTRLYFARRAYRTLLRVPVLGTGFRRIIHTALPPGKSMWIRIPEGLAKDFWIYANPRLELGYANGDQLCIDQCSSDLHRWCGFRDGFPSRSLY